MTKKEFIEWMEKNNIPDETELECSVLIIDDCNYARFKKITEEHLEFIDLTGNQFIDEDDPNYNKKFLTIGLID